MTDEEDQKPFPNRNNDCLQRLSAELEGIWRNWAYGKASNSESLNRFSRISLAELSILWKDDEPNAQDAVFTVAQSLAYVTAMVFAIKALPEGSLGHDSPFVRTRMLRAQLPDAALDERGAIPHAGVIAPPRP